MSVGVAVVDHDHRLTAGAQDAAHLRDRACEIAGVMQAADAHDDVEGLIGVRDGERGAHRHAGRRGRDAEHFEPVRHHRHRAGRDVEPVVVEAALGQELADRSVAEADLEDPLARVPRQVSPEIRIEVHVRAVEAREADGRVVDDAQVACEAGAAQLGPEVRVRGVQVVLRLLCHRRIIPHAAAGTAPGTQARGRSRIRATPCRGRTRRGAARASAGT